MNESIRAMLERAKQEGLSAAFQSARNNETPYLVASDERLGWDTKGVVRLDAAILALRIATARIALRSVPEMLRQRIQGVEQGLVRYVGGKAAGELAILLGLRLLGRVLFLLKEIYTVWSQAETEKAVEQQIRLACLRTMRETLKLKMQPKKGRVRITKRIASRNPKP